MDPVSEANLAINILTDLSLRRLIFRHAPHLPQRNAFFMGHLALEKLVKALIVKRKKTHAPFSHSLPFLAENANMEFPEDMLVHLREFMEFHFEARYPDVTNEFYKKCTRDYTDRRLKEMKKVFKWIKARL